MTTGAARRSAGALLARLDGSGPGRRLAGAARCVCRCLLVPSTAGPWPWITFTQHRFNAGLWRMFLGSRQYFGGTTFYQSCDPLGLPGQRPTTRRIAAYGLPTLLPRDATVLDIGCNSGFFSLAAAGLVGRIVAIEKEPVLVAIAGRTARFLGVRNVVFECADFTEFVQRSGQFDVVFAFAVRRWASSSIEQFAGHLSRLVKRGGLVLFESNNLARDPEFGGEVEFLERSGFAIEREVDTDFDCPRRLVVLRRL